VFTVNQDGACTATITPDSVVAPAAANSQSVSVDTPSGCAWTATSAASWLTVSPAGGTGAGTVALAIAENTGAARTTTATIASRTVTITQEAACTFAISPTSDQIGKGGGPGTVTVQARDGCPWTASSNVPWITIVSGDSGSGTGIVTYNVDKNGKDSPARTGTITIAGQTFTLTQKEG
jgi:hypothetical protein